MIRVFIYGTGILSYLCMLSAIVVGLPMLKKKLKINVKVHMVLGLSAFIFATAHVLTVYLVNR